MGPSRAGPLGQLPPDYNRYEREYVPFNFTTYDDEDFYIDWDGCYAKHFILGGKEATGAANKAIFAYRCAADQVAEGYPAMAPPIDTIYDQPAEVEYPEDRSPAE